MSAEIQKLPAFGTVLSGKLLLIKSVYKRKAPEKLGVPPRRFKAWFTAWPSSRYLQLIDEHYAICWELRAVNKEREKTVWRKRQEREAIHGKPSTLEPPHHD